MQCRVRLPVRLSFVTRRPTRRSVSRHQVANLSVSQSAVIELQVSHPPIEPVVLATADFQRTIRLQVELFGIELAALGRLLPIDVQPQSGVVTHGNEVPPAGLLDGHADRQASITLARSRSIGVNPSPTAALFAASVPDFITRLGDSSDCSTPVGGTRPSRMWSHSLACPCKTGVFSCAGKPACDPVRGKTAGCCSALVKWSSVTWR